MEPWMIALIIAAIVVVAAVIWINYDFASVSAQNTTAQSAKVVTVTVPSRNWREGRRVRLRCVIGN